MNEITKLRSPPNLLMELIVFFESTESLCGERWTIYSLDFIILTGALYIGNMLRCYLDLLKNLPLIIDFDMIIKFLTKGWLASFERNFHKILWLISINIFKDIMSMIDEDYWPIYLIYVDESIYAALLEAIFDIFFKYVMGLFWSFFIRFMPFKARFV